MKREYQQAGGNPARYLMAAPEKGKMVEETDTGVDELLAALGYKVRSSDMADVAQKLEQLEMAMAIGGGANASVVGSIGSDDNSVLSHLASDTVYYNPSDLSTWLESMLSEINAPPPPTPCSLPPRRQFDPSSLLDPFGPVAAADSSAATTASGVDIPPPGRVLYDPDIPLQQQKVEITRDRKRMRSSSSSSSSSRGGDGAAIAIGSSSPMTMTDSSGVAGSGGGMSVLMVDTQEAGIQLVHALLGCAEAVQQKNLTAADALLKRITILAVSQGGAMRKVAGYFAEALVRRVHRLPPPTPDPSYLNDILDMHFYEYTPYLKFAHFTANQAILEAFSGRRRVHVIDFSLKQGMQWPALLQALALRPGGPPSFRLTGIGPLQSDNSDALQQVGWTLAQLAEAIHVDFEFRGFVASSLADLEPSILQNQSISTNPEEEEEAVAVNSIMELHRLLALPGALEKVLSTVKSLNPKIFTVVEQEANHNSGSFVERFTEALHYYSTMFDSVEGGAAAPTAAQDQVMTEVYLGQQIYKLVACDGTDRTERHETLAQWRRRFTCAGFRPVHVGSNAYKQASMLLSVYGGGEGYRVEEREGCLTLGWHTRPLIAASAWCVGGAAVAVQ